MSDRHVQDPAERWLDDALATLRTEEPSMPMRRDVVWEQVQRKRRRVSEGRSPFAVPLGLRRVAAATIVVAAGALLLERTRDVRTAHHEAGHEPLLADAVSILRALPTVTPGSAAADSLGSRSVLLLAAARVAVDSAQLREQKELLQDVEYVMAQVVEGGLEDTVERDLTIEAIRQRRMIERAEDGGAE